MAQALVRFLDNQYIDVDGSEIKFVKGFRIFITGTSSDWERKRWKRTVANLAFHQGRNEQG